MKATDTNDRAYLADPVYNGLVEDIAMRPHDRTPRAALHDWLLDRGRHDRAQAMASGLLVGFTAAGGSRWRTNPSAAPQEVQRGSREAVEAHLEPRAAAAWGALKVVVRAGLVEVVQVSDWDAWRCLSPVLVRCMPLRLVLLRGIFGITVGIREVSLARPELMSFERKVGYLRADDMPAGSAGGNRHAVVPGDVFGRMAGREASYHGQRTKLFDDTWVAALALSQAVLDEARYRLGWGPCPRLDPRVLQEAARYLH